MCIFWLSRLLSFKRPLLSVNVSVCLSVCLSVYVSAILMVNISKLSDLWVHVQ